MRFSFALLLTASLSLSGCAHSRAQAPKEYVYSVPCSALQDPAHIVVNKPTGVADTTLALLSGRIVNYLGTYGTDLVSAENITNGKVEGSTVDKQGAFLLYLPEGRYRVRVMSSDFSPFTVEELQVHSGRRHRLDVFLDKVSSPLNPCVTQYRSKRKLSPEQLAAVLDEMAKKRARFYQQRTKARTGNQ